MSDLEKAMSLLAKAWFSDGYACTSPEWRKDYFALDKAVNTNACDGGLCGLGGYCMKCPKLEKDNT